MKVLESASKTLDRGGLKPPMGDAAFSQDTSPKARSLEREVHSSGVTSRSEGCIKRSISSLEAQIRGPFDEFLAELLAERPEGTPRPGFRVWIQVQL